MGRTPCYTFNTSAPIIEGLEGIFHIPAQSIDNHNNAIVIPLCVTGLVRISSPQPSQWIVKELWMVMSGAPTCLWCIVGMF